VNGRYWTAERDRVLSAQWNAGKSASEIGKVLNCSRNSVISRARRIGLAGRPSPIVRRDAAKEPQPALIPRVAIVSDAPSAVPSLPAPSPAPPITSVRTCAYPMWPADKSRKIRTSWEFCGAPVASVSYCETHADICTPNWRRAVQSAA